MTHLLRTSLLLLFASIVSALPAQTLTSVRKAQISDSLNQILLKTTDPAKRLDLTYDIFDLAPYSRRDSVGRNLVKAALATNNTTARLDAIRRLAALYTAKSNTDSIEALIALTDRLNIPESSPFSRDYKATRLFLDVQKMTSKAANLTESERQKVIHDIIRHKTSLSVASDDLAAMGLDFFICRYLESAVPGSLLTKYLNDLGNKIANDTIVNSAIKSSYYVQASRIYTTAAMYTPELHAKAIETCDSLISIIHDLERENAAQGRKYREYVSTYYQAYRRMLANFPGLPIDKVDQYYQDILDLRDFDPSVGYDLRTGLRPTIYWHMAHKRYAEALPLIKQAVENKANSEFRFQLFTLMLEAATALGDREAMLQASLGRNEYLESFFNERLNERSREIGIIEQMQDVMRQNDLLSKKEEQYRNDINHSHIVIAIVIAIVLLVIILIMYLAYRRTRKLSDRIALANTSLTQERDNLQRIQAELIKARDRARKADRHKTEFIHNMSHEVQTPLNAILECSHLIVDNVDPDKQVYLRRYADTIDVSADMLRAIINDVLQIAKLDSSSIELSKKHVSVNSICEIAVDNMRKHCQQGVTMTYLQASNPDFQILADGPRVEQILTNLLLNAAKFTEYGSITLSYTLNHNNTITFAVADTGIGVPKGKEEVIFERFHKLSNLTPGAGLGLSICRMLAGLMGGTVSVDNSYPGPGARFLLTIPV